MKNFKRKKQNQQKVVNINVNPDDLEAILCECGHDLFIPAVRIKRMSALVSPNGQEQYLQIPVSVCLKCDAVLGDKS